MLIRAYRIENIANLDPLSIQKKMNTLNLNQKLMVLQKDFNRQIFLDGVLGLQYGNLNQILKILKKTYYQLSVMSLCIWEIQMKSLDSK